MSEIRVLATRVQFIVQEKQPSGRYDVISVGTMDYSGHIDIHGGGMNASFDQTRDRREALIEAGMAEVGAVTPGELQPFATPEFLKLLEPALLALPQGWQDWNSPTV